MAHYTPSPLPPALAGRWLEEQPLLRRVVEILRAKKVEAYLTGGAVRDLLLGRSTIHDLDFAVPGDGLHIARVVADALGGAYYPLDAERSTGRVILAGPPTKSYLDFAAFRCPTLLEDLADRDFTINAIALRLTGPPHLIDPLGGQQDLQTGQIRATSPAAFSRDPVRVVRAVRQAVQFGFTIEVQTAQYLRQAAAQLPAISPERQRDELLKLLTTPAPGEAIRWLHRLGVLPHILPAVAATSGVAQSPPHHLDVLEHTAAALDAWAGIVAGGLPDLHLKVEPYLAETLPGEVSRQTLIAVALLLHDTGKPLTRTEEQVEGVTKIRFLGHERKSAKIAARTLRHLHFSERAAGFVEQLVLHHMYPLLLAHDLLQSGGKEKISRRAIYRFFRESETSGVAVLLHALADHEATYPSGQGQVQKAALLAVVHQLSTAYFEQADQVISPPPLLTGRDLIAELGLTEGKLIGLLLRRLQEAQAVGEVTDRAAALAFIQAVQGKAIQQGE